MHVAVVIRNVVDCRVPLPADSYLEKPLAEGLVRIINPSDWAAFEQALALKQQGSVKKLTVLHLGPLEGEDSLRWCLAAGADAAQRLWDPTLEEADQLGKGKTLAAALQRLEVQLVFSGNGCLDQLNSLMPGISASVLGMAYVTEIEKIETIADGQAIVICRREKGKRERVSVSQPTFFAITETGWALSVRADLAGTLAAFTQEIPCWDLVTLGLAADTVGGRGTKIANIQIRPSIPPFTKPQTPDFRLSAEERLRAIITGGTVRKQGEVVTGQPEKLVANIIKFLCREPAKCL